MRILFDLNVLIDVASRWQRFPSSLRLYDQVVSRGEDEGCFPACGYTTLFYVLNQILSAQRTRAVLLRFRQTLTLLPFNHRAAAAAHRLQMPDLEDACVAATAYEADCDVIATRNVRDFFASPIPASHPDELVARR